MCKRSRRVSAWPCQTGVRAVRRRATGDRLSPEQRAERGSYVGCIAGALSKAEYERGLAEAGFSDVRVTFTHAVADGLHSAIVQATKRTAAEPAGERKEVTRDPDRCCDDSCCG